MFETLLHEWIESNQLLKDAPILNLLIYTVISTIIVILYKLLPYLWNKRSGQAEKERNERDTTRENVKLIKSTQEMDSKDIREIRNKVDKHNGALIELTEKFNIHKLDDSIHSEVGMLVLREYYDARHCELEKGQVQILNSIDYLNKKLDEVILKKLIGE